MDIDDVIADAEEWPFQPRCEEMCNDLFDSSWQVRHGAAIGIRAILRHHGDTAGISASTPVAYVTLVEQAAWVMGSWGCSSLWLCVGSEKLPTKHGWRILLSALCVSWPWIASGTTLPSTYGLNG